MGSPYMDGVPLLTQCPISPASTFQYRFSADNAGTHYYHSHSGRHRSIVRSSFTYVKRSVFIGFQRADGAYGPLIVRQSRSKDPSSVLYDYDLPEHVILVSDWLAQLGLDKFVAHAHAGKDDIPSSIIINGKGRISKPKDELSPKEKMPLAVFNVEQVCKIKLDFRLFQHSHMLQNKAFI